MTQAVVLDGKAVATRVRAEVKGRAAEFTRTRGRPPGLAVVRVGSDPASAAEVERAEIVVAAVGKPGMIQGAWIRPGAVVFDVGINRTDAGPLVGDVEYALAATRAGWITPVPGGIGPMTIAMLLSNTLDAALARS